MHPSIPSLLLLQSLFRPSSAQTINTSDTAWHTRPSIATQMFVPMVTNGAEIKAVESGGTDNEATTWNVYRRSTPGAVDFNVTVGPTTILYDVTTTEESFVSYMTGELEGFWKGSDSQLSVRGDWAYISPVESVSASVEPSGICTGTVVRRLAQGNLVTSAVTSTMTGTEGYRNVTVLGDYEWETTPTETGGAAWTTSEAEGETAEIRAPRLLERRTGTAWKEAVVVVVAAAALAL